MGILEGAEYLFGKDHPDRQYLLAQEYNPSNGESHY